jgi:periplasmic divalent cation tolerance protein
VALPATAFAPVRLPAMLGAIPEWGEPRRGDSVSQNGYLQVITAIDAEEGAQRLAQSTVEARLAACVQVIGPIRSTYWWQGAIESTQEWLCLMKTPEGQFDALAAHIKANHPYEVPEITATPITYGSRDYLGWIEAEATGKGG